MNTPKDLFSQQSGLYAKFRPTYPQALYDWILSLVPERNEGWDCGTGNGQVASELAQYFQKVQATDISQAQIEKAPKLDNVHFQVMQSEATSFENDTFDLITVAQALHWFAFEPFFKEVQRVIKPGGILAVWGYSLLRIHPEIDPLLDQYYTDIIGPYWAPERKHVDQNYAQIAFPFDLLDPPESFAIQAHWTVEQFEGYLRTWSSLQTYLQAHEENPVPILIQQIRERKLWEGSLRVQFPIFTKVGSLLQA
ncbi:MAG: class I SAM-dependent methyltransferase [Bacteroidota bacterium]